MAQVDAFLKLENIKGESADEKHKGQIDIVNWHWGMNNDGTGQHGAGSGAGKVKVHDISITKLVDASSPILMKACVQGDHIKKGTITVRKAGGKQLEYFKIDLEEILVSGIQCASEPGSPVLNEQITLNFRSFKVVYTPQTESGAAGAPVEYGYDLAKGKSI